MSNTAEAETVEAFKSVYGDTREFHPEQWPESYPPNLALVTFDQSTKYALFHGLREHDSLSVEYMTNPRNDLVVRRERFFVDDPLRIIAASLQYRAGKSTVSWIAMYHPDDNPGKVTEAVDLIYATSDEPNAPVLAKYQYRQGKPVRSSMLMALGSWDGVVSEHARLKGDLRINPKNYILLNQFSSSFIVFDCRMGFVFTKLGDVQSLQESFQHPSLPGDIQIHRGSKETIFIRDHHNLNLRWRFVVPELNLEDFDVVSRGTGRQAMRFIRRHHVGFTENPYL